MSSRKLFFICAAILLFGSWYCQPVGEYQEENRDFPLGGYSSASVDLDMATGEMRVQGGARELFEGHFTFNVEKWAPEFRHEVRGDKLYLTVKQGDLKGIPLGKARNRWDISLNEAVPVDLRVDFGAGESRLDLRGLNLRSVEVDMGVGDVRLDLSGPRENDLHVTIDGGVGSSTVYLPEDVGVRVMVDKGIGSVDAKGFLKRGEVYTNEAYDRSGVTLHVDIDAGIGKVDLRLK
jgi:hypothetical protein